MSWDLRDSQKQHRPPGTASPQPQAPTPGPALPSSAEFWGDALPSIAAMRAAEWGDEERGQRLTMQQRQALRAEGMCPDDEWQAWSRLMKRGVTEV